MDKKTAQIHPLTESIDNIISLAESDSFKNIVSAEVWNKLSNALQQLPPQGRQIINMIFFEGKKHQGSCRKIGRFAKHCENPKRKVSSKVKKVVQSLVDMKSLQVITPQKHIET